MKVLFHSELDYLEDWMPSLKKLLPEIDVRHHNDIDNPAEVDIALILTVPPGIEEYKNLKAILSLGAGINQIDLTRLPVGVPVARLKDTSLIDGMKAYCRLAVARYHRDFHVYEQMSRDGGPWTYKFPKLAAEYTVGILGLGQLGSAVGLDLCEAGYRVTGWARNEKRIKGIETHIGAQGLSAVASSSDILINLLPLTRETTGILNKSLFDQMRSGSFLINVGRGKHLVDHDLLEALSSGRIQAATLDVFAEEPLNPEHRFWRHPKVLITPHVATAPNPDTAAALMVDNMKRALRGERLINQVDRDQGY